ncbi:MFS glucose transporter mfs1 [Fusarium oxysporum f. sp. cubense]|uniref:MFS glucose transporter mfs1 n=1 Tax=Fusarium oxysporum f. sp. cubense TaxID=61366 RepID=A0A559KTJ5_FUSOC|nr:MFS glucose transporter mfs1 [Fusarium oxysporum f. sp. cubense]
MAISPKVYQFLVGLFASLGSMVFGYDLGVIAGVIAAKTFINEFHPNDDQTGLIVSLFTGGAFVGAALAAPTADYYGRRATLFVGAVVFLIGGIVQTAAQGLSFLWGGRFVAGLGVGFLVMIVPLYQAELAHPSIRGRVTALQQFMLGMGAFLAAWITYGTFVGVTTNSGQWRIPLAIQNVPAIILAALIWLFPESPRWLISKDKNDLGLKTLAVLHSSGDTSDAWVLREFQQIQDAVELDRQLEASSYLELFKSKNTFRRVFLCCAVQASIQMTGVAAIQYYAPTIYGQIGISPSKTLMYQGISNAFALLGEMSCMSFIDKLGRRWTMIGGMLAQMCTFLVATILLAKFKPEDNEKGKKAAQWAFIIITCWLFNFIFSATSGSLSWIIPSEVFDTRTRAKGVSLATMTSFAFNTMIGQVVPRGMSHAGYRFYYLFVICNFTNALFFYFFLPEISRIPLEDMNAVFNGSWLVPGTSKRQAALRRQDVEAEAVFSKDTNKTEAIHGE